jgi:hypothetical protein
VRKLQHRLGRMKETISALESALAEIRRDHNERVELERGLKQSYKKLSSLMDELLDGVARDHKERIAGILSANEARQQKATGDYKRYRRIADALVNKNPILRRSRHRLAQFVRAELKRQGQKAPSLRTISTALKK